MNASRAVPGAAPVDTDLVSIIADPAEDGSYDLASAWFGALAPQEPWDPDLGGDPPAYEESIHFWCSHALVYNPEVMDEPFQSTWEEVLQEY